MSIFKTLLSKNKNSVKFALIFFFSLALIWNLVERFQYIENLGFKIYWSDIELFILINLIVLNPKGIRFIVISVIMVLIFFSTQSMFFSHMSGLPLSLLFRNIFTHLKLDSSIVYLIHLVIYSTFIYSMIKPFETNKKTNDEIIN